MAKEVDKKNRKVECHGNQDKKTSGNSNALVLEISPRSPIFKANIMSVPI